MPFIIKNTSTDPVSAGNTHWLAGETKSLLTAEQAVIDALNDPGTELLRLPDDVTPASATSSSLKAVTPGTGPLPEGPCRALWIGGAGDVAIIASNDTAVVVLKGVPAGTSLPIAAKSVLAANTTATDIVALY